MAKPKNKSYPIFPLLYKCIYMQSHEGVFFDLNGGVFDHMMYI